MINVKAGEIGATEVLIRFLVALMIFITAGGIYEALSSGVVDALVVGAACVIAAVIWGAVIAHHHRNQMKRQAGLLRMKLKQFG